MNVIDDVFKYNNKSFFLKPTVLSFKLNQVMAWPDEHTTNTQNITLITSTCLSLVELVAFNKEE